jgi:murein lipoprotein
MKGKEVMKKSISTALKAGIAAMALVASSGCVSQKAVDEIKATADKAVQDAAAAKAAADSAASSAQSARSAADSAQSAANQALQAAQASQACCDATNEKIDRMFKKSQSK